MQGGAREGTKRGKAGGSERHIVQQTLQPVQSAHTESPPTPIRPRHDCDSQSLFADCQDGVGA